MRASRALLPSRFAWDLYTRILSKPAYANDAIGHPTNEVIDETMEHTQDETVKATEVAETSVDQTAHAEPGELTAQPNQNKTNESRKKGEPKRKSEPLQELPNLE